MESHFNLEDRVFSVPEAAKHLRVSRSLLYEMIKRGEIRTAKIASRSVITGREMRRSLDKLNTAA